MFDDFDDKTEAPTEHRRAEARRAGHVARSTDLSAAGLMLAAACVLAMFSTSLIQACGQMLHQSLHKAGPLNINRDWVTQRAVDLSVWVAQNALPPILVLMACALAVNLLQVGFLYSPDVVEPNLSRLSPFQGVRRIVSLRSLARLGFSLGKVLLVMAVACWSIARLLPEFLGLAGLRWHAASDSGVFRDSGPIWMIVGTIRGSGIRLAFALAAALLLLALLDFAFQKWTFERELRMSRDELREELKNIDGDPLLRQRRREARRRLAQISGPRVEGPDAERRT